MKTFNKLFNPTQHSSSPYSVPVLQHIAARFITAHYSVALNAAAPDVAAPVFTALIAADPAIDATVISVPHQLARNPKKDTTAIKEASSKERGPPTKFVFPKSSNI
jgi:hypothetical protein